jgi:hypothetical protein
MRRSIQVFAAVALVAGLVLAAGAALAGDHSYVGVDGCKMCHKKEATGDQYNKWLNGPHAKAFETLKSEAAAKAIAAKGLTGNAWELDECLGCHVTGHGVDAAMLGKKYAVEDGVGCESCHGPGSEYKSAKVMKDHDASVAAGLVVPTAETCTACHNEKSPTFKGFDFAKYTKQIAHPNPSK